MPLNAPAQPARLQVVPRTPRAIGGELHSGGERWAARQLKGRCAAGLPLCTRPASAREHMVGCFGSCLLVQTLAKAGEPQSLSYCTYLGI
jgi:hypothetical protein